MWVESAFVGDTEVGQHTEDGRLEEDVENEWDMEEDEDTESEGNVEDPEKEETGLFTSPRMVAALDDEHVMLNGTYYNYELLIY